MNTMFFCEQLISDQHSVHGHVYGIIAVITWDTANTNWKKSSIIQIVQTIVDAILGCEHHSSISLTMPRYSTAHQSQMWKTAKKNHYRDVIMSAMASQISSLTRVYSIVYSGADQRKHKSYASLAFARGIHQWPVNSPHKEPVTRNMFPFDDVIMITLTSTPLTSPWHLVGWLWNFNYGHLWDNRPCYKGLVLYSVNMRGGFHIKISSYRWKDSHREKTMVEGICIVYPRAPTVNDSDESLPYRPIHLHIQYSLMVKRRTHEG